MNIKEAILFIERQLNILNERASAKVSGLNDDEIKVKAELEMSLHALRKQEPQKVKTDAEHNFWECQSCQNDLMGCCPELEENIDFCPFCGQSLDWRATLDDRIGGESH